MSKCQISITFDRPDRVYFGGETVRGVAKVIVQEDTQGNGIRLTHRWRTHGRGNAESGPEEAILLAPAQQLMAGEQMEFPFEITAPTYPVTYRGHLIFLDHYIRVDVDVPWARNPWAEEEYILRPGQPPPQMTGSRDQVISLKPPDPEAGLAGKVVLWLVLIVLVGTIAAFAFFLLPIIAAVGLYFWLRKLAVAARTGNVEVTIPQRIVAPSEPWSVSIRFTPRKSFQVNRIFLEIVGKETATSGSGSNKTTTTHELFSEQFIFRDAGLLMAGETVDEKLVVPFPDTRAFSLEQSDNTIKWTAEVRIDIPRYPDWSTTESLQVVPIEFFGAQAKLPDGSFGAGRTLYSGELPGWSSGSDEDDNGNQDEEEIGDEESFAGMMDEPSRGQASILNEETRAGRTAARSESMEPSGGHASGFPPSITMQELVQQLGSIGRNNTLRTEMIAAASGRSYEVSVVIDRIVSALGTLTSDGSDANGKTVTGKIVETQQAIEVAASEDASQELERLRRGDTWTVTVQVTGWDSLYNRLRAVQAE